MKSTLLLIVSNFLMLSMFAQSQSNVWQERQESELSTRTKSLERVIIPNKYKVFTLDLNSLVSDISSAPNRISNSMRGTITTTKFPNADGTIENYRIQKTGVMHPDLAVKYPNISTYYGQSISNPLNKIYFTITPQGFRGVITGKKQFI